MRNLQAWTPTKFVKLQRGYAAGAAIAPGSRIIAEIQARVYSSCLREHARGALLDLGCGAVPLYETYRDLTEEVVCADWPQSMHGNQHIDIEVDLNGNLPFADACFDTVLMTDVLEHVYRPEIAVAEAARVLRPRGKLILSVPFLYWLHEQPYDFHRYTEFALRRLCTENHLQIVSLEPYGGAPEVFCDLASKCVAMMRGSRFVLPALASFSRLFLASAVVRRFSQKTARSIPLGYCLVACRNGAA